MPTILVKPTSLRPDFRLVLTFLWGDDCNCDTDGNAQYPAGREWTELYCRNRENPTETFDVSPVSTKPLVLAVESPNQALAARAAYFIAIESVGLVTDKLDGPFTAPDLLISKMGEFDLDAARKRVHHSGLLGDHVVRAFRQ
jgi:hypothetical protein